MKNSTIFHDDFEKCSELWPAPVDRNVALEACSFQNRSIMFQISHNKRKTESTLGLVSRMFLHVGTSCSTERRIQRF